MSDTLNANTGGAGSLGAFIPEIWANTALEVLRSQIVLARLITKDTDVATFSRGDILNIPVPGTFSVNDKAVGSGVTLQNPSAANVNVTLDQHREVTFVVEDPARAQANQDTVATHVRQAAVALAEDLETKLAGLASGFSSVVGTVNGDASAAGLRAARKALNDNKAPMAGRFITLSPQGEVDLLGDSNLSSYFANSQPEGVSEARIGRAYGFDVYMSQLVTATGTGATGIAGTPEFGLLAMRSLPTNDAPGVSQMAMRDPLSGIVIRQTASYDTSLLGVKVTLDMLYGYTELRDACGVAFVHDKD